MTLNQLLQLDPGAAITWLITNSDKFELVPVELSPDIRHAFHVANGQYRKSQGPSLASPDHQWDAMLAEIRKQ